MVANLTTKVAIVTGGSRGIGSAVAQALVSAGATVVASSRNVDESPQEVPLQERMVFVRADAGNPDDVRRLVTETMRRFGRIDILVNNAGNVPYFGPTLAADLDAWDATFTVNLRGAFAVTREVVSTSMGAHGGAIINVASITGLKASAGLGVYGIAKAGLIALTKQLAKELGPSGVRVNAVAPGVIKTDFSELLWGNPDILQRILATNPTGRVGVAEEVAGAVAFLASDAASYINGEVLVIDGGGIV
jgi:NAD(P)-dependent dehydrogenase (short-subunit alcohol dehydrogenase family)